MYIWVMWKSDEDLNVILEIDQYKQINDPTDDLENVN
jgi:hypothetical protein